MWNLSEQATYLEGIIANRVLSDVDKRMLGEILETVYRMIDLEG